MRRQGGQLHKKRALHSAKESVYVAAFVALLIAVQLALSVLPGVELVTVLFVSFAFVFGKGRGMVAATAFSLLRQVLFGVFLNVLILYLVYFNLLALIFGAIGNSARKKGRVKLWLITLIACLCTVGFTLFDNLLTPVWYGFTPKATKTYFIASLPFVFPQVICTFLTVGYLFLPLKKVFSTAAKNLKD